MAAEIANNPTTVIVTYRPRAGQEAATLAVLRRHVDVLRKEELVTEFPQTLLLSKNGTFVEIFEWAPGAIAKAHENPRVTAYWAEVEAVCEYTMLASLEEAQSLFSSFSRIH